MQYKSVLSWVTTNSTSMSVIHDRIMEHKVGANTAQNRTSSCRVVWLVRPQEWNQQL